MYLRVRCFACPAFLLYNVGTGNFRGRRDTKTPLLAYLANNLTYVVLVSTQHSPQSNSVHVTLSLKPRIPCTPMRTHVDDRRLAYWTIFENFYYVLLQNFACDSAAPSFVDC